MISLKTIGSNSEKQSLLVFPLDIAAHYLRCLGLCKKLSAQFDISFAYSPKYDRFVKKYGFSTFEVGNFNSEEIKVSASSFDFSWLNLRTIKSILESQIAVIAELNPSLVLGDTAFTLKMAAEKTGVPYVSILNGYMTKYCCIARKVSPSHPGYPYSKTMPKKVFNRLSRAIEHSMLKKIHEPFRRVRKELGLSRLFYLLDELEGDFNLICDLPDFFPQKNLPENYEFVGPLFYQGDEEEQEVLDFLENDHLHILVSTGSTGNWKNLNLLCDPVFSDSRIVISGNASNGIRADNVLSNNFLNHMKIMAKVDIVICHGGNGTVYQALSNGIPLLFFSGNFEQEWNIQRIIELGLGTRLEESFDAFKIREIIDTWIRKRESDSFRQVQQQIQLFAEKPLMLNMH